VLVHPLPATGRVRPPDEASTPGGTADRKFKGSFEVRELQSVGWVAGVYTSGASTSRLRSLQPEIPRGLVMRRSSRPPTNPLGFFSAALRRGATKRAMRPPSHRQGSSASRTALRDPMPSAYQHQLVREVLGRREFLPAGGAMATMRTGGVMKKLSILFFGAAFLILSAGSAKATPVLWTLECLGCPPSLSFSGSFIYDADTDTYSAADPIIDTSNTSGSPLEPTGGVAFAGFPSDSMHLLATPGAGWDFNTHATFFTWLAPLTNAAVDTPISGHALLLCGEAGGCTADPDSIFVLPTPGFDEGFGAFLTATPLPNPAALPLFLSGLAVFGSVARRRRPGG